MRITPSFLFDKNYHIICHKNALDNSLYEKVATIHSLQKKWITIEKLNSYNILKNKYTQKAIPKGSRILPYKASKKIYEIAQKNERKIIWNKPELKEKYENKKNFRQVMKEAEIEAIPGKNIKIETFLISDYQHRRQTIGESFVIQIPELNTWWGLWTIFVHNKKDFFNIRKKLEDKTFRKKKVKSINITKFIKGIDASILGCVTTHGIIHTSVQKQISDIPEVINVKKGSGLFCWHDRSSFTASKKTQEKAEEMVKKLGKHMKKNNYKGIFGFDVLIEEKTNKVYPVECNARMTWAMPMISLIDIKNKKIPIDFFHIAEHLGIQYEIDISEVNKKLAYDRKGSHIILNNRKDYPIEAIKDILPGIYTEENGTLIHLREGFTYNDIKEDDEFIIINGNLSKGQWVKEYTRQAKICHMLFPIAITKGKWLTLRAKKIIKSFYKEYFDEE